MAAARGTEKPRARTENEMKTSDKSMGPRDGESVKLRFRPLYVVLVAALVVSLSAGARAAPIHEWRRPCPLPAAAPSIRAWARFGSRSTRLWTPQASALSH